jgi:Mce-associated membrane protein
VAAARQEVANLTDLDYRHAGDGVDAILGLATGSFRQQFSSTEAGFRTVLISGQVESRGQITQAAVASTAPGAIRVLVAAKAVVSNTAAKNETRLYRIAVTTVPSQGRWLVSDMDFVS